MSLRYQGFGTQNTWGVSGASASQTWTMTAPSTPGTMNLRGEVFDAASNGTTGSWYTVTVVQNQAPTATLTGPSARVIGESGTWNFSATDANSNLKRWRFYASTNPNPQWSTISGGSSSGSTVLSFANAGTYTYILDVEDTSGATATSSVTTTVTANQAPVASITPSTTTLFLNQTGTWNYSATDANANLSRWRVSLLPATAQWTTISGGTQSSSLNYSFSSAGSYTFRFVVEDTVAASATSDATISVVAGPAAIAATAVSASAFTANWSTATSATKYRLDVSTSSTFASYVTGYQNRDVSTATTLAVTGLSANTTYYYRVRAENNWGASANSGTVTVTTLPNAPTAPTASSATSVGGTAFTANWGSASGATGYRLDVSTSSSFASYVAGYQNLDVGNAFSSPVTGLVANTTYYYRVRATNAGGASGNSNTVSVATTNTQNDTANQNQLNIHIPTP